MASEPRIEIPEDVTTAAFESAVKYIREACAEYTTRTAHLQGVLVPASGNRHTAVSLHVSRLVAAISNSLELAVPQWIPTRVAQGRERDGSVVVVCLGRLAVVDFHVTPDYDTDSYSNLDSDELVRIASHIVAVLRAAGVAAVAGQPVVFADDTTKAPKVNIKYRVGGRVG